MAKSAPRFKATPRKNGEYMVTVQVTHHLSKEELMDAVGHHWRDEIGFDGTFIATLDNLKASDVRAAIKEELHYFGCENLWVWSDRVHETRMDECRAALERVVERTFPEMAGESKWTRGADGRIVPATKEG